MAKLKKAKSRVKKAVAKKISARAKVKKIKQPVSTLIKKEIPGAHEMFVERIKFSHPEAARPATRSMPSELPNAYGKDKLVLLVRDPWWLYAYWELTGSTIDRLRGELKEDFNKAKRVLRVYDVSKINFNGHNAHRHFDIFIRDDANSWYIDTQGPGRSWIVDLGLILADGRFITILRSNVVHTPLDGPSWITDEEWMIPDDMFARLYGMGFGFGKSSAVGKGWQQRIRQEAMASGGLASMASPVKKAPGKRQFWLKVDCELIVYGATEPDAKVTVQGKAINLRQDGTFTLRFALPDGKQVIPVKAVSNDRVEEREITPTVTRSTKTS